MVASAAALSAARREVLAPSRDWTGMCLAAVRTLLGVPALYPDAITAWRNVAAADRHSTPAPAGVPEFFDIGARGHVVLSDGDPWCYSSDIKRRGKIDRVQVDLIESRWGARRLGWAATLNGVRVWTPPAPSPPAPHPAPAGRVLVVAAGDTVSGLVAAHATGNPSWSRVWHDPHNAALVRLRGGPERIQPGDHLWVP